MYALLLILLLFVVSVVVFISFLFVSQYFIAFLAMDHEPFLACYSIHLERFWKMEHARVGDLCPEQLLQEEVCQHVAVLVTIVLEI